MLKDWFRVQRFYPVNSKYYCRNQLSAAVTLYRPREYLGHGRDTFLIDSQVPDGVNEGVPGSESATVTYPAGTSKSVKVVLNEETLTVKIDPEDRSHKIIAMFHY